MDDKTLVDQYFLGAAKWQQELVLLRSIISKTKLQETYKWRNPCYTSKDKNIAIVGYTKNYFMISFFKGVLLKDEAKLLTAQTKNMQSDRQLRFTNSKELIEKENLIIKYINEAIEIEEKGLKIAYKTVEEYDMPKEMLDVFNKDQDYKNAFGQLTPGRRKGYLLYFSSPKKIETKYSRIADCKPRIMQKKGLNDCICGLSKRMPNCDGSHKQLVK